MTRSGKMQATHHLGIVNRCALIKGKDTEESIQSSSMYLCTADNCVMLDCKCIGFMDYLLHLKYMHQNCKIKLQVILYIGLQHMGWGGDTQGGRGDILGHGDAGQMRLLINCTKKMSLRCEDN